LNRAVYDMITVTTLNETAASIEQESTMDNGWSEILEQIFDDSVKECVNKLIHLGISAPSAIGFELQNSSGVVIAECELAWEEKKIAILLPEQWSYNEKFNEMGWTALSVEDSFVLEMFQRGDE
jgi:DEAD/DEAH box helicase domain-containing protein